MPNRVNGITNADSFASYQSLYGALFTKQSEEIGSETVDHYTLAGSFAASTDYYGIKLGDTANNNFWLTENYIKSKTYNTAESGQEAVYEHLNGLYNSLPQQLTRIPGYLVDASCVKYLKAEQRPALEQDYATKLFVQETHAYGDDRYTVNGLGRDSSGSNISKDSEYQLKSKEFLLVNYTNTKTDENGTETKSVINKY